MWNCSPGKVLAPYLFLSQVVGSARIDVLRSEGYGRRWNFKYLHETLRLSSLRVWIKGAVQSYQVGRILGGRDLRGIHIRNLFK